MLRIRPCLRVLLVAALVGGTCLPAFASLAYADEAAPPEGAAPGTEAPVPVPAPVPAPAERAVEAPAEEDAGGITPEDLEKLVFGSPLTLASRILLTFLPALLGAVILLVLWIRHLERRSARKAGIPLPEARPWPEPTVPFDLLQALVLACVAYLLIGLLGASLAKARPDLKGSIPAAFATIAAVSVPLAALVLLRRARLRGGVERPSGRALLRGYLTYCVGTAVALAITYPWASLLLNLGEEPKVQQIIQRAADPAHPEFLWLTGFFAVVIAPITEETIFRGLLFPAARQWLGGGRRATWIAAIIVSLAFAASHEGPLSFSMGPLFGLAMVLTWAFARTDSLLVPMLGHAFFNASTVIPMLVARGEGLL